MADQLQALRVVAERLVDWNRHWPDDRWYSVEQIKQMDREMRAINAMAQHALAAGVQTGTIGHVAPPGFGPATDAFGFPASSRPTLPPSPTDPKEGA